MAGDPTFFILPAHLHIKASESDTLLNTITKNFRSPFENYVPTDEPNAADPRTEKAKRKGAQKYYRDKDIRDNSFDAFKYMNTSSDKASIWAVLKGLAGVRFRASKDSFYDLNGKTIEYRILSNHETIFENLKDDPEVQRRVPAWIEEREKLAKLLTGRRPVPVCWITGIFIAHSAHGKQSTSVESSTSGTITFPAAEIAGSPAGGPNPELGGEVESKQKKEFEAHGRDGNIFALELKVLKLTKVKQEDGGSKTRIVNTERNPTIETGRQLGPEDEEESGDESDDSGPDAIPRKGGYRRETTTSEGRGRESQTAGTPEVEESVTGHMQTGEMMEEKGSALELSVDGFIGEFDEYEAL